MKYVNLIWLYSPLRKVQESKRGIKNYSLLELALSMKPKARVFALIGSAAGEGRRPVICTVMEAGKSGLYRMLWQGLFSCKLPAFPDADLQYSYVNSKHCRHSIHAANSNCFYILTLFVSARLMLC